MVQKIARVQRIDIFWLDVEGAELAVLQSIAWGATSVGVLVVEMRFNDATRNSIIMELLTSRGFELVHAVRVWSHKVLPSL